MLKKLSIILAFTFSFAPKIWADQHDHMIATNNALISQEIEKIRAENPNLSEDEVQALAQKRNIENFKQRNISIVKRKKYEKFYPWLLKNAVIIGTLYKLSGPRYPVRRAITYLYTLLCIHQGVRLFC